MRNCPIHVHTEAFAFKRGQPPDASVPLARRWAQGARAGLPRRLEGRRCHCSRAVRVSSSLKVMDGLPQVAVIQPLQVPATVEKSPPSSRHGPDCHQRCPKYAHVTCICMQNHASSLTRHHAAKNRQRAPVTFGMVRWLVVLFLTACSSQASWTREEQGQPPTARRKASFGAKLCL